MGKCLKYSTVARVGNPAVNVAPQHVSSHVDDETQALLDQLEARVIQLEALIQAQVLARDELAARLAQVEAQLTQYEGRIRAQLETEIARLKALILRKLEAPARAMLPQVARKKTEHKERRYSLRPRK